MKHALKNWTKVVIALLVVILNPILIIYNDFFDKYLDQNMYLLSMIKTNLLLISAEAMLLFYIMVVVGFGFMCFGRLTNFHNFIENNFINSKVIINEEIVSKVTTRSKKLSKI